MIQQITNTRSDKQLTKNDIAMITYASCLNFFYTNTMFSPFPFGIYFSLNYDYVKRLNSDSYQYQNGWGSTGTSKPSPNNMDMKCNDTSTRSRSQIEKIHPDLVCDKDGDERVLIYCAYRRSNNFNKSKLGLFMMDPGYVVGGKHTSHVFKDFLYYSLIITPKPGLFPGKNN